MRIVLHAPFAAVSEESGTLFLVGRYLRRFFKEMQILRCSGSFPSCDRDVECGAARSLLGSSPQTGEASSSDWKRYITTCFECMTEIRELSDWSEIPLTDISSLINKDTIQRARNYVLHAKTDHLLELKWREQELFPLIAWSYKNRFSANTVESGEHEAVARRYMVSSACALEAATQLVSKSQADLAFVVGGRDFISASIIAAFNQAKVPVAILRWDIKERLVKVRHPSKAEEYGCGLLLGGLANMRPDPKTWPLEILTIVEEIVSFVGIELHQMVLQPSVNG
jgi:hypothetical protein